MKDEWQPIETAPRDGTPILIFDPSEAESSHHYCTETDTPMKFDDPRFAIGYWRVWQDRGHDAGKWKWMWGNRNSVRVEPTHWMPLPAPPTLSPQAVQSEGE